MAKSRARFLSELLGTTGLVKKSKSALAGADEVIDLSTLPSIPNSKLTNSSISIAGHSTALGGSVTLDTADIGEDTNLYYTDARADARITNAGSANWNTAYTYSQVGHLPLSGGTLTGNLSLGDNVRARFGDSQDLQIYHNNNSSYIRDMGTGNLYIDTNGARISLISDGSYSNGKMADFVRDGAVILYYDNSEKLKTTSTGINVTGKITASSDITVSESGNAKVIVNSVGDYFPSINISRTSGSSKTNYEWEFQIGSSGHLNFKDKSNGYYPAVFKNNGDVALANDTDSTNPVLLLDKSAESATFAGTVTATGGNSTNWNTAYGWGNHASGGYAPLASPTLTGTPVAPTAAGSTSTTQLATTAFVQQELTTLIGGAPSTLNDLNELAAAINDDANYNSTLTTALATKLPKAGGTMTGNLTFNKEDPNITLSDTSTSRTLAMFVDNNNSVVRASGPLLLQVGSQSALTIDTSRNSVFAGNLDVTGIITGDDGLSIQGGAGNAYLQVGSDTGSWTWKNYRATHKLALEDSDGTGEVLNFDTSGNATFAGTVSSGAITSSGDSSVGASGNISMSAGSAGQFKVLGAGYTGAIALDANAMHIYHNSSSRDLILGTNETARLTIGGSGGFNFNSNNLTSIGTISSGAISIGTSPESFSKLQVKAATNQHVSIFTNSSGLTIGGITDVGGSAALRIAGAPLHLTGRGGGAGSGPDIAIISNGNVGIGTDSPLGKFVVSNGGAEGFEVFPGSASGQNSFQHYNRSGAAYLRNRNIASEFTFNLSGATDDAVTFKADGNVGIGTATPKTRLHIGTLTGGDGTAQEQLRISGDYTNTNSGALLRFTNQHNSGTNPNAGEYNLAGIKAFDFRSDWGGAIALQTAPNTSSGGTLVDRLVINPEGLVGIGTTAPDSLLHIKSTGDARMTIESPDANDAYINFSGATNEMSLGFDKSNLAMYITNHGTLAANRRVTIKTDGKFGIGTTAPASLLHVHGTQSYGSLRISPTSTNGESAIAFFKDTAGTTTGTAWVVGHAGWGHTGDFVIGNQAFGGPLMLMQQDGKVGIGTTSPGNTLTVKAANCTIDAQSTADGQTIGFRAGYQNHTTLHGLFRYTTGDAQLYIDNEFIGNNAVYSDINFRNKSTTTNGSLINRLKIKGSTGHVGIGVTTPQHQLTVQHDTDPSIYIVGNGYNDTVRIGFGGGDVNNVMGNGNTGAIISSAQTTSSGQARGDLRFQINKGDNLQTALHISNQGFATFDHQGSDYGIAIKTSGSSRSGLVILTPATNNVTASALVLGDGTYRLGTAGNYHQRMDQDGKTQIGFDKQVSIGDHYGNSYTAARFNINAGTGTGDGATGKTGWYGPRGRGHKSFAGQDAFNIYDQQREWTGKHIDAGGNSVNQTASQNYTNDHGLQCNYPSNVTSQQLIYSDTPKGGAGTILRAQADTANTWNGGFQSNGFPCSTHVGLQYSMYVRRASSQSSGTFYMGCFNAYPGGTSTTVNNNPYFYVTSMGSLPQGVWCLVVAYLAPINYNGSEPGYTGIYRLDTGDRLVGQTLFRHYSTTQNIRTYMYYAGDGLTKCDWYAPRIHLVDGTEPSITQLMGYGRVYGSNVDL